MNNKESLKELLNQICNEDSLEVCNFYDSIIKAGCNFEFITALVKDVLNDEFNELAKIDIINIPDPWTTNAKMHGFRFYMGVVHGDELVSKHYAYNTTRGLFKQYLKDYKNGLVRIEHNSFINILDESICPLYSHLVVENWKDIDNFLTEHFEEDSRYRRICDIIDLLPYKYSEYIVKQYKDVELSKLCTYYLQYGKKIAEGNSVLYEHLIDLKQNIGGFKWKIDNEGNRLVYGEILDNFNASYIHSIEALYIIPNISSIYQSNIGTKNCLIAGMYAIYTSKHKFNQDLYPVLRIPMLISCCMLFLSGQDLIDHTNENLKIIQDIIDLAIQVDVEPENFSSMLAQALGIEKQEESYTITDEFLDP